MFSARLSMLITFSWVEYVQSFPMPYSSPISASICFTKLACIYAQGQNINFAFQLSAFCKSQAQRTAFFRQKVKPSDQYLFTQACCQMQVFISEFEVTAKRSGQHWLFCQKVDLTAWTESIAICMNSGLLRKYLLHKSFKEMLSYCGFPPWSYALSLKQRVFMESCRAFGFLFGAFTANPCHELRADISYKLECGFSF